MSKMSKKGKNTMVLMTLRKEIPIGKLWNAYSVQIWKLGGDYIFTQMLTQTSPKMRFIQLYTCSIDFTFQSAPGFLGLAFILAGMAS